MKLKSQSVALLLLVGSLCLPGVADNRGNQNRNRGQQAQNNAPNPGKWLKQHLNDPPQEQQRQLQNDPDFKRLNQQQQQHLQQRLQQFNSLPPQQRERIVNRMQKMEALAPDKQQLLRNSVQPFRQLPDDRRRQVRRAWNSLSQMPPEQQQQVMNSDRFKSTFNDDERSTLKGLLDSGFNPQENNGGPPR